MMQDLTQAQWPMTHVRVNGDVARVRDAYIRVVEAQRHHYVVKLFTLDNRLLSRKVGALSQRDRQSVRRVLRDLLTV